MPALDIYSTRAQLAAIDLMPREYSVLYDFFARETGNVEDDKAIYDFRKGSREMAPMVIPGGGGVVMGRGAYETKEIGFCQIAPERVIENNDLKGRAFGERILGALTPQEREKRMLARDIMEMRAAIQRRREWMVRQVLLNGKLEIFTYNNEGRGKLASMVADYSFTNIYTADWTDPEADIDYDMKSIFDMVYDGLGYVDRIIMAPDVASVIMRDPNFTKLYDMKNVNAGEIKTRYAGSGLRYIGTNADGVDLWSCSGNFVDDDGVVKPLIPSGKLIAGSANLLNVPHGPVTQVEEPGMNAQHKTYIKKEVPLRYGSVESNAIKNRITSCPTVVPVNVDGWVVATVL